ncbi:MAG: hypothetical protein OXH69_11180 [Acidobacteria bacterium]|nr:hypothetical protein [Acidobacteriota bacterium]
MTATERRLEIRRTAERERETQDKLGDLVAEHQDTNASLDVLKKNAIATNEKLDQTNAKLDKLSAKLDNVISLLEKLVEKA